MTGEIGNRNWKLTVSRRCMREHPMQVHSTHRRMCLGWCWEGHQADILLQLVSRSLISSCNWSSPRWECVTITELVQGTHWRLTICNYNSRSLELFSFIQGAYIPRCWHKFVEVESRTRDLFSISISADQDLSMFTHAFQ